MVKPTYGVVQGVFSKNAKKHTFTKAKNAKFKKLAKDIKAKYGYDVKKLKTQGISSPQLPLKAYAPQTFIHCNSCHSTVNPASIEALKVTYTTVRDNVTRQETWCKKCLTIRIHFLINQTKLDDLRIAHRNSLDNIPPFVGFKCNGPEKPKPKSYFRKEKTG